MKIVILGAGNLAWHLAPALRKSGHVIPVVYSKTRSHAETLAKKTKSFATNKISEIPSDADLYLVAVQDKAIRNLLLSLPFSPNCIAHTSGSIPLSVFPKRFKNVGVFYPLQSFSISRKVNFTTVPLLLEANNLKSKKILKQVATDISGHIGFVSSIRRKQLHLAAVFANNFVNYLYSLSADILKENKLSFDLLKPLILETALKVQSNLPEKMQTGPARRNDQEIIKSHLQLLKGKKSTKAIYVLLNDAIINKFK